MVTGIKARYILRYHISDDVMARNVNPIAATFIKELAVSRTLGGGNERNAWNSATHGLGGGGPRRLMAPHSQPVNEVDYANYSLSWVRTPFTGDSKDILKVHLALP